MNAATTITGLSRTALELSGQDRVQARIEELRYHMQQEGEALDDASFAGLGGEYVYEQKMKLVMRPGARSLYLVPSDQDWEHDALGSAIIIPGTLYAEDQPFCKGSAVASGYFQADGDGRWAKVTVGAIALGAGGLAAIWKDDLAQFPEVARQLEECAGSEELQALLQGGDLAGDGLQKGLQQG